MSTTITKLEHSSILIEHKGKRILFDPGVFSKQSENLQQIDILLITHSHGDHLHEDNIKYVVSQSPNLKIITNSEVSKMIDGMHSDISVVDGSDQVEIDGIVIKAHDYRHEEIFEEFGQVQNTGYYIDDVFFHPGDAFTTPNQDVKSVATVISAPFMSLKNAIYYINSLPNLIHIGVHDSVSSETFKSWLKGMIGANIKTDIRYEHPSEERMSITI